MAHKNNNLANLNNKNKYLLSQTSNLMHNNNDISSNKASVPNGDKNEPTINANSYSKSMFVMNGSTSNAKNNIHLHYLDYLKS